MTVVRNESHLGKFINAKALFEKLETGMLYFNVVFVYLLAIFINIIINLFLIFFCLTTNNYKLCL